MVKFCARLARLLSKSPVKTLPVAVALTGCPVTEITLDSKLTHRHIGIKKLSKNPKQHLRQAKLSKYENQVGI